MRVLKILSDATNVIAEGEVLQLLNTGDPGRGRAKIPRGDPAQDGQALRGAARLGAVLGDAGREIEDALARYGMHLGTAFQLIDDVLDYSGDHAAIGKNLGDDLAEGKPTLPLIRALAHRRRPRTPRSFAPRSSGAASTDFQPVLAVLHRTGALDYARACAETESAAGGRVSGRAADLRVTAKLC